MRALSGILAGAGIFALLLATGIFDHAPPPEEATVVMGDLEMSPYVYATQRGVLLAMDKLPPPAQDSARPIIERMITKMQNADADVTAGLLPADAAGFEMITARQQAAAALREALPPGEADHIIGALNPDPAVIARTTR